MDATGSGLQRSARHGQNDCQTALGRKNFLFAGSDAGAERAAVAYTVLATCALHELDPWAYVKDVLEKIAAGWSQRDIDRLLPDRWLEQHPEALRRNPPA